MKLNRHWRIVLADDDADDRELFEEAFSEIHPNSVVTTAQDGEELSFILRNYHKPDLVFLDLNMPRKNGIDCLTEIRNNVGLEKIPVIIYSTSMNPADIDHTFNLGAALFVRKPNSFEELKRNVAGIFKSPITNVRTKENFLVNNTWKTFTNVAD